MTLQELLVFSGILVLIAGQDISIPEDLQNVIPHHYTIKIAPYKDVDDLFRGDCVAFFTILRNTQTITFHSENMVILKAEVIRRRVTQKNKKKPKATVFSDDISVPTKIMSNTIYKTVTLYFNNILLRGNHTLNITYFGPINNKRKGLFKIPVNSDGNTSWIYATHIPVTGAHEVFPYLRDSTIKTTFNISIWHYMMDIPFSSSMKRNSVSNDNDDMMMWTHFQTTPPMSSNAVAIVIVPGSVYKNITSWPKEIIPYPVLQYDPRSFINVDDLISFFTAKFGALKFERIDFIMTFGFQYDTIAALGLVLHRAENVIFDDALTVSAVVRKNHMWRFFARQIALQWFLDMVKPSEWSYQWMNSVAEFFGIYALDKIYPTSKMMNWFVVHTVQDSLHLDVHNLMEPIIGQKNTLSNTMHLRIPPFIKVSAILSMIEQEVGQELWDNTKTYLLNEPLLPSNIWFCLMSDSQSLSSPSYRNDCRILWMTYIRRSNYPMLNIEQRDFCQYIVVHKEYANNTSLSITEEYSESLYQIPSEFSGFSFTVLIQWYGKEVEHFLVDSGARIQYLGTKNESANCLPLINVNQPRYYRVNYEYDKWKHPEEFINTSLYVNLPVLTRAQIIDDEYHLLGEKETTAFTWQRITQYLLNETNYEAWYPAIRILEEMSSFFPFSDNPNVTSFKALLKRPVNKLFHRIETVRNDTSEFQLRLRYEAFKWACLLSSNVCRFRADIVPKNNTNASFRNRYTQVSDLWHEWIPCDKLRDKNISVLDYIVGQSELKNFNGTLVRYIPCLGFKVALEYLDTANRNSSTNLNYKRTILFRSLVEKHGNNYTKQILNNFSRIKPRTMNKRTALCIVINHVYSERVIREILFSWLNKKREATTQGFTDISFVFEKSNLRLSQIKKHEKKFMQLFAVSEL